MLVSGVASLLLISVLMQFVLPDLFDPGVDIVLDPGHGGDEYGAVGNDIVERDSNLDMALRVEALLVQSGLRVALICRTADRPVVSPPGPDLTGYNATFRDLENRIDIANRSRASAIVSIHSNQWSDQGARGIDVWYNDQRPFADRNKVPAVLVSGEIDRELRAAGYAALVHEPGVDTDLAGSTGAHTPFRLLGPGRDVLREELIMRGGDP